MNTIDESPGPAARTGAARSAVRILVTLCAVTVAVAAPLRPARALTFDPLVDAFTQVQMNFQVPYLVTAPSSPDRTQAIATTDDGPTSLSFAADAPANFSIGAITGFGAAEFDRHRARFDITGPSARVANILSLSHDVLTVARPADVPVGTAGTLKFVYLVTGSLFVELNRGALPRKPDSFVVAGVGMSVTSYRDTGGAVEVTSSETLGNTLVTYGDLVARAEAEVVLPLPPAVYAYHFDVPFVYGEPFGLSVSFQAFAEVDRTDPTTLFSPFRELRGEGLIGDLSLDFADTAALMAIVNALHPDAGVTGRTFDYTPFVTDVVPVPVPIPSAMCLILVPLLASLRRRVVHE
ncbi:MAG: hypothetical protein AB7O21_17790 [Gammaproteobacteria bacterium]